MKKIKKLSLNKDVIANLDQSESSHVKGGWSLGCTDGCTGNSDWLCTALLCTYGPGGCTNDCVSDPGICYG